MELKEILAKVDGRKLKRALASDDASELSALLAESGIELTDEQLDYIAGGIGVADDDDDWGGWEPDDEDDGRGWTFS